MKRMSAIIVVLCCFSSAGVFAQRVGAVMYVGVQSASLKSSTGFFAGSRGTVHLGDQVSLMAVKGNWVQVRAAANGSLTGWIAYASLTSKKIVVQGNGKTASAKELALAGKGFSEEVEAEYKTGKNLNYAAVDALEKVSVSDDELLRFIDEGRLAKGEL